ncbi:RHS repeat-associated core domain-containing protein [Catellatospora vulcania]|uniref:RHS repeat-associated core domain-containing protein n=1 Tax=Catellatospora vulcania TaxID=1460450 RepID=UPI0012D3F2E3|nr:RHS repeat-associated core domain-containing protein [Catellatospora vulcania]
MKDPNGNRTTIEFDAEGRETAVRMPAYTPPGTSTPLNPVARTEYDDAGRITKSIDPSGIETWLYYDQQDRISKLRTPAPDGGYAYTRYTYDKNSNVLSTTDPLGAVSSATYDFMDRRKTATDAGTHTTNYEYSAGGWLSKVTSPSGIVSRTQHNAAGQTEFAWDAAGKQSTVEYDKAGRPLRTINPDLSYTRVEYDMLSQVVEKRLHAAGGAEQVHTSSRYDRAGRLTSAIDGLGHTTEFGYDDTGLLVRQSEPISAADAIVSTFGYDPAGNRTRFTNGRGYSYVTTYNTLGLEESTIEPTTTAFPNPADRTYTKIYDGGGRLAQLVEPGGVTVGFAYNAAGQLSEQTGTGAEAATKTRTITYDAAGRVKAFSGAGAADNTVEYDPRGLVASISGAASGDTAFTYTADGQLKTRTDAAGNTVYEYDGAGRLHEVTNGTLKQTYDYDDMSRVKRIDYGTGGDYRVLDYYPTQRLKSDKLFTLGGATVASLEYEWDANGNPLKKTTTGVSGAATNVYTYDWANRLTSWTATPQGGSTQPSVQYEYDKAGNRTLAGAKVFAYDARNRLTSAAGDQYTYTARGTLRTVYDGTSSTTSADAFGQIRSQAGPGGTQTYDYDALGRAIQPGKKFTGLDNDLAEDSTAKYVRDPANRVIGQKDNTGAGSYAWTDLHDDVIAQFGASDTTVTRSVTYDPFGAVIAGGNLVGSLGYQSEWTDTSTGRVNMAARWYNTETGQFDSRDTASNSPSPSSANANRYAYGNANPLVHTDPSGHVATAVDPGYTKTEEEVEDLCATDASAASICGDKASAPPPPSGGGPSNNPDDGPPTTKAEIERLKAEIEAAQKMANKSFLDVLIECGVGILLDFLGITDIINCFTKGDLWACADMVMGILPVSKLFTMGKKIFKAVDAAFSAYKAWKNAIKVAEQIIEQGKRALEALEKLNDIADTVNTLGELAGIDTGLPTLPLIPFTGGGNKKKPSKHSDGSGAPSKPKQQDPAKPAANAPANTAPHQPVQPNPANTGNGGGTQPDHDNGSGDGPSCPRLHSFDPKTPVLMADGSVQPIEDVEIGDEVLATDPETGEDTSQEITHLHLNYDVDLTDLTVSTVAPEGSAPHSDGEDLGAGTIRGPTTTTLYTTQHHPFWDATLGEWVDAADLEPGHELTGPLGEKQYVTAVRNYVGGKDMRDLTVANVHTYYVIAGNDPVLVHNNDPGLINLGVTGESCPIGGRQGWVPDAAEGFPSYDKTGGWVEGMGPAKDFAGPGETLNWEHVVEQRQGLPANSNFPQEWINHPDNMMLLDSATNFAKNGYYSKKFNWTGGQKVRDFLTGMPFNQQWDFGMYVINTIRTHGKQGLVGDV